MVESINWVKKYATPLKGMGIATLLTCVALALVINSAAKKKRVNIEARKLFDTWVATRNADPKVSMPHFNKLSRFLNKYPHLQKSYDPLIMQHFINAGPMAASDKVAKRAIGQIKDPYVKRYSKVSYLLAKGEETKALEISRSLASDLPPLFANVGEPTGKELFYQNVHFFNLYRVGALLEKMGRKEESVKAFSELKSALEQGRRHPTFAKGVQDFVDCFTEQAFSLDDYLSLKLEATE